MKYRKTAGIIQTILAGKVVVDGEMISRFERGSSLSLVRSFEIAQALDVDVGDFKSAYSGY